MVTWSTRVKELRSKGMTFPEIAELVGLAPSSVSDIAYERTKAPSGDAALKLFELHRSRCSESEITSAS